MLVRGPPLNVTKVLCLPWDIYKFAKGILIYHPSIQKIFQKQRILYSQTFFLPQRERDYICDYGGQGGESIERGPLLPNLTVFGTLVRSYTAARKPDG